MNKRLKATSQRAAIIEGRRLCPCVRHSFEGVQWRDPLTGVWTPLTWSEVDGTRSTEPIEAPSHFA